MTSDDLTLNQHNVLAYLAARGLAKEGGAISVRELGGGVSNIVLLIEWREEPERRWVVKQSLEKLRVQDGWRLERARVFREAEAIQSLRPALGEASLPEIIHIDRENSTYVMTAAPAGSPGWEDLLLTGEVDSRLAPQAARLLAQMMMASRADATLRERFADRTVFDQLRVDPYYRTTARRNPEVRGALVQLVANSWNIQSALVHGDYSPKNMLVHDGKIFLIDFGVIHWGDPAFDTGFFLNHLFLKSFHRPESADHYFGAVRDFWKTLAAQIPSEINRGFEALTIRHVGGLMLGCVDGDSPAEYIRDENFKEQVRGVARQILRDQPQRLDDVIELVQLATQEN